MLKIKNYKKLETEILSPKWLPDIDGWYVLSMNEHEDNYSIVLGKVGSRMTQLVSLDREPKYSPETFELVWELKGMDWNRDTQMKGLKRHEIENMGYLKIMVSVLLDGILKVNKTLPF